MYIPCQLQQSAWPCRLQSHSQIAYISYILHPKHSQETETALKNLRFTKVSPSPATCRGCPWIPWPRPIITAWDLCGLSLTAPPRGRSIAPGGHWRSLEVAKLTSFFVAKHGSFRRLRSLSTSQHIWLKHLVETCAMGSSQVAHPVALWPYGPGRHPKEAPVATVWLKSHCWAEPPHRNVKPANAANCSANCSKGQDCSPRKQRFWKKFSNSEHQQTP